MVLGERHFKKWFRNCYDFTVCMIALGVANDNKFSREDVNLTSTRCEGPMLRIVTKNHKADHYKKRGVSTRRYTAYILHVIRTNNIVSDRIDVNRL